MFNFLIPAGTVKVPLELNVWVPPGARGAGGTPPKIPVFLTPKVILFP
jgi:hypothetical protein